MVLKGFKSRMFQMRLHFVRHRYTKQIETCEPVTNLKIGDRVSVSRTVTTEDVQDFARLTKDYNPIHIDSPRKVVHGAFLNGLISGVLGMKLPGPGTIVTEQILKYPKPCYVGDTLQVSVEVVSVRKIIKCKYTCVANSDTVVLEGEAKLIKNDELAKKLTAAE